jgi:hypothetical protein
MLPLGTELPGNGGLFQAAAFRFKINSIGKNTGEYRKW